MVISKTGAVPLSSIAVTTKKALHLDEGWHLHQPASTAARWFHDSGMWPFLRQT
jgi:hypothetical protein